jgi:hypothetical protein
MIRITASGSTAKMDKFLADAARANVTIESRIRAICDAGVRSLQAATPVESGATAAGWGYEIETSKSGIDIYWTNTNVNGGVAIAVLLQYGHGTGTGGYVQGRDYINPALKPIFDKIADDAWKAVTSA